MISYPLRIRVILGLICIFAASACTQNTKTSAIQDEKSATPPDGTTTTADTTQNIQKDTGSANAKVSQDRLITPGVSVGLTHLKESMTAVFKRLGKPDKGDAAMGKSMSTWYAKHDSTAAQTSVYAVRSMGNPDDSVSRVKEILVTSPFFTTADGIHTGLPYNQIAERYSLTKTAVYGKGDKQLTVYNSPKGIAFEFGPDQLCKGIYVAEPGASSGVSYLAFHPELERMNMPYSKSK